MIVYVEDVNDEAPVFTQQQYSRLALRETAGIGTSVIVVRATDRDTGEASGGSQGAPFPRMTLLSLPLLLLRSLSSLRLFRLPNLVSSRPRRDSWDSLGGIPTRCPGLGGLELG